VISGHFVIVWAVFSAETAAIFFGASGCTCCRACFRLVATGCEPPPPLSSCTATPPVCRLSPGPAQGLEPASNARRTWHIHPRKPKPILSSTCI
jgi:hypothetical protein